MEATDQRSSDPPGIIFNRAVSANQARPRGEIVNGAGPKTCPLPLFIPRWPGSPAESETIKPSLSGVQYDCCSHPSQQASAQSFEGTTRLLSNNVASPPRLRGYPPPLTKSTAIPWLRPPIRDARSRPAGHHQAPVYPHVQTSKLVRNRRPRVSPGSSFCASFYIHRW